MKTAERDESIERHYLAGASLEAAGKPHGLTIEGTRYVLKRRGVPIRGRGRPRKLEARPAKLASLRVYKSGEPLDGNRIRCGRCKGVLALDGSHECPRWMAT